jgi:uncharacterized CHY-type Zn-finger protein
MTRVYGATVDDETRCIHYRTPADIVAIKFACCGRYYPCHLCHAEAETHEARQWPVAERETRAILCGVCKSELTISTYLEVLACPNCGSPFNEGCRLHTHLYFEVDENRRSGRVSPE